MLELQRKYVQAGTHILYAPTFTANRLKLEEYGLYEKQQEIIYELVKISKEAAANKALVAGDITMTGISLKPIGSMELEELITIYKEQIRCLENAGVDLLVVETMMSLAECRAAVIAAKEVSQLPIMVTLTFEKSGRTLFGTDAKTAAIVLQSLGVDAIGVNCSAGPADMVEIIKEMNQVLSIPIIAKPNAGLPQIDENGHTVYDMDAVTFCEEMQLLINAGATFLGGCCGTDENYISLLKEVTQKSKIPHKSLQERKIRYVTSETRTVSFALEDNFIIVGERINPTGKKKLQQELREHKLDMVLQFATEQEEGGASILDVNMGMSGIDEKEMMLEVLMELSGVTDLPLSIDSSHIDVLEAALRQYPGRALVNSVSFEKEKMINLLPIIKKYGAMFILLPLSDEGLPKTNHEKQEIIDAIVNRAIEIGMVKEDIVVDGLVTTIGANKSAAIETLETICYCKENDLATICGLSNISFGMPARTYVNTAFLTMAIQCGLTMAIANPSQEMLMCTALATDLLLHKRDSDLRYIQYASTLSTETITTKKVTHNIETTKNTGNENPFIYKIREAVLKGNRTGIVEMTQTAIQNLVIPKDILNQALIVGINEVGNLFEQKKYFLPQLIASAEAMKNAIEIIEPYLEKEKKEDKLPLIIIATVEGDIHDIGKNLVALMLKNYGFNVIDLGKDVPKEVILECAKVNHADIIALSALMTTTMQRMKDVVELVKKEGLSTKVIIGGAVITQDYADEINADGYSKDAAEAVKLAKRLLGLMITE